LDGEPDEEALLLVVGGEAADELVGDGGNGVIPAEPLIERFLLRARRGGEEASRQRGKDTGVRIVVMGIPFGSPNESRMEVRATRSGVSRGCCVMREA
jgi:hypothetical protein